MSENLDQANNFVELATISELFANCKKLCEDANLRAKVKSEIQKVLPENYLVEIDELGICRIGTPLHITSKNNKHENF